MLSSYYRSNRSSRQLLRSTLGMLALLSASFAAVAEEPIHLNITHRFPAEHYLWSHTGAIFTQEVTKASNGRVTFDVFPASQLGKDSNSLLKAGLVDMAMLVPSYESDKLPLSSVVELPNMYQTSCEGTHRYWKLAQSGGVLGETEFKRQGLHVLFVAAVPPYEVMTATKNIKNLESMSGLKIRGNGASMLKAVEALGAVPVQIPSPEMYEALSRGTIDGAIFPYYSLTDFHLEDITRHSTQGVKLGGGTVAFAVSIKTWDRLPAHIQNIMTQAALNAQDVFCTDVDKQNLAIRKKLVDQHQHVVSQLPAEEIARWNLRLSQVAKDWVDDMENVKQPGADVLQAYLHTATNE